MIKEFVICLLLGYVVLNMYTQQIQIEQMSNVNWESIKTFNTFAKQLHDGNLTVPGKLVINGNVEMKGTLTVDKKIHGKKDIEASGNGYFGPAYIGAYGKSRQDYAQFSHKGSTAANAYSLIQHSNGLSILNSKAGHAVHFNIGDQTRAKIHTGHIESAGRRVTRYGDKFQIINARRRDGHGFSKIQLHHKDGHNHLGWHSSNSAYDTDFELNYGAIK